MRLRSTSDDGFTLAEICVAMTILVLAATGGAQLFGIATGAAYGARVQTTTTVLASQKIEALRAVTRGDPSLAATPPGSLDSNVAGAFDYLDSRGAAVAPMGSSPPPTARFIRRWSITPLPQDSSNVVILQVFVTTVEADRRAVAPRRGSGGDALVTTILTNEGR